MDCFRGHIRLSEPDKLEDKVVWANVFIKNAKKNKMVAKNDMRITVYLFIDQRELFRKHRDSEVSGQKGRSHKCLSII